MIKDILKIEKEFEIYSFDDEIKLEMLINIVEAYIQSNPSKSIIAAKEAITLAEQLGKETTIANAAKFIEIFIDTNII